MFFVLTQHLRVGREYSTVDGEEMKLLDRTGLEPLVFWHESYRWTQERIYRDFTSSNFQH